MSDAFDAMTIEQLRHVAREMDRALTTFQTVSSAQENECRGWRNNFKVGIPGDQNLRSVIGAIIGEVWSANCRWGTPADHARRPDGCGGADQVAYEVLAKDRCDRAGDKASWAVIADEEWAEAAAAKDTASLKIELRQCAAVAIRWLQAIEIREAGK